MLIIDHNNRTANRYATFIYLYVDDFVDFPELDGKTNKNADFNNKIGFIVENIEQHNKRLKDVEENRSYRQTLQWLAVSPELDICLRHPNGKVLILKQLLST